MLQDDTPDVLIIGAGPAGLTAATYLGRFLRQVLVADGGEPRAGWIPVSHNMPGFPKGLSGASMLERMREQAREYGAVIEAGRVESLRMDGSGFVAVLNGREVRASSVLLATGVVDRTPDIAGVDEAVRRSLVRICPICDGYEAQGQRVAVIGDDDAGAHEAAFLRTYSDDVTLLHIGASDQLTERAALARLGIALVETALDDIVIEDDRVKSLSWGGKATAFDLVYSALGTTPSNTLALSLGAVVGDDGRLVVDDHCQTTVLGLYAAGDVVKGLNQIAVATSDAAIATTAIHNGLREREGRTIGSR